MASVLLIGCIVDPIKELYIDMVRAGVISETLRSSANAISVLSAISEVLITLNIGANIVYLCLLCPGIWQYFISKLPCSCHSVRSKKGSVKARCHLSETMPNTSHSQVSPHASPDRPGTHTHIDAGPSAAENNLANLDGPHIF